MDSNTSWAALTYVASSNDAIASRLPLSWTSLVGLGLLGYVSLCSVLRFQRIRHLQSRLNYPDRQSLSRMTVSDAQEILNSIAKHDCPTMYDFSLRLALIRVSVVA